MKKRQPRAALTAPSGTDEDAPLAMKNKEWRRLIRPIRGGLLHRQGLVKATGSGLCTVFEGGHTARDGGVIKVIAERLSPAINVAAVNPRNVR